MGWRELEVGYGGRKAENVLVFWKETRKKGKPRPCGFLRSDLGRGMEKAEV